MSMVVGPADGRAATVDAAAEPEPAAHRSPHVAHGNHRRAAMRRDGRGHRRAAPRPTGPPGAPPRDRAERDRRLQRVNEALASTIRACPAPGMDPFTWRDRATIGLIIGLGAALVAVLVTAR